MTQLRGTFILLAHFYMMFFDFGEMKPITGDFGFLGRIPDRSRRHFSSRRFWRHRRSTLRHLSCTHLEGSASTGIEKPFAIRQQERLPEERLTLAALVDVVVFTRSLRVRF